jgi:hypothetical protein
MHFHGPGRPEVRIPIEQDVLYGQVRVVSRGQEIVSVASRVVNPKHDELHPVVSKELYQLHRKIWMYKMSNKWKVLTQLYCTLLYTQLYAHTQNC